jgi:hypothetical protein
MEEHEPEGYIGGPIVDLKNRESLMRPLPNRVIARREDEPEENVDRYRTAAKSPA